MSPNTVFANKKRRRRKIPGASFACSAACYGFSAVSSIKSFRMPSREG
jgi:hypothetical protein